MATSALTSRFLASGPHLWLAGLWTIAGVLAIIIPVIRWNKKKRAYYNYYGRWQEYNQNGEQQNNQQDYNNYNYNPCKWWQWGCKKRVNYYNNQYYNNNGEGGSGDNIDLPDWYTYFGGETEEQRRWREENGQQKQLKWLYVWTLLLFVGLVAYGAFIFYKKRSLLPLTIALVIMVQFTILTMLLLAQGVIETDGREMEDSVYGFYGQPGVLTFMSDLSYTIFCLVTLFCLAVYAIVARYRARKAAAAGTEEGAYKPAEDYEAPPALT